MDEMLAAMEDFGLEADPSDVEAIILDFANNHVVSKSHRR